MRRLLLSLGVGAIAGLIDVTPMIALGTSRQAMASAFVHWVVLGFLIAHLELGAPGWVKGLVVALLSAIPVAILVAEQDPSSLLPIFAMSSVLGSAVGHVTGRVRADRASPAPRPARS